MQIEAKLEILDSIDGVIKTPWKNGYYYSTKATQMLQKFEGNTAEAYSHLCLDFPDLKPMGPPGTITYGDFGSAHEKIQKVSGGIKNYNVKIVMSHGKFPRSNSNQKYYSIISFSVIFYHLQNSSILHYQITN